MTVPEHPAPPPASAPRATAPRAPAPRAPAPPATSDRIVGIDVLRLLAIVGMMVAHVLVPIDAGEEWSLATSLSDGFPSTVFAVLGGVSLHLASAGRLARGDGRGATVAGVVRGLIVAVIGLTLGLAAAGIAVVLTPFGIAMLLASLVVGARSWLLAAIAVPLTLGGGLTVALVQSVTPEMAYEAPSITWAMLDDPVTFARELMLTGVYPVITWLPYMLWGMLAARFLLRARSEARGTRGAVILAGIGAVAFTVAQSTSLLVQQLAGERVAEAASRAGMGQAASASLVVQLIAQPHTGSIADMVRTMGVAFALLGVFVLALDRIPPRVARCIEPLRAAGAAPLTIYTAHVLLFSILSAVAFSMPADVTLTAPIMPWFVAGPVAFGIHVALAIAIGGVLAARGSRGPLEAIVSGAAGAAARSARARR